MFNRETLYRYYDKIIENIKTAENKNQLLTCQRMFQNHSIIIKGSIAYSPSKTRMINKLFEEKGI